MQPPEWDEAALAHLEDYLAARPDGIDARTARAMLDELRRQRADLLALRRRVAELEGRPAAPPPPRPPWPSRSAGRAAPRALVAVGDAETRAVVEAALRAEGWTVTTATDGHQALQRWEVERPDLVLLEGTLPEVDGFEVGRRLRRAGATPVLLVVAEDEGDGGEAGFLRAFRAGADDVVLAPVSAEALVARLRVIRRRLRRDF
jgi:CheY-like chemotaxis protein